LPKAFLKALDLRQPVTDRFEVGVVAEEAGKGSGSHRGE